MEPFKNFINAQVVRSLSSLVRDAHPEFASNRFEKRCLAKLDALELKERAIHIGETLWSELPDDFLDLVNRSLRLQSLVRMKQQRVRYQRDVARVVRVQSWARRAGLVMAENVVVLTVAPVGDGPDE